MFSYDPRCAMTLMQPQVASTGYPYVYMFHSPFMFTPYLHFSDFHNLSGLNTSPRKCKVDCLPNTLCMSEPISVNIFPIVSNDNIFDILDGDDSLFGDTSLADVDFFHERLASSLVVQPMEFVEISSDPSDDLSPDFSLSVTSIDPRVSVLTERNNHDVTIIPDKDKQFDIGKYHFFMEHFLYYWWKGLFSHLDSSLFTSFLMECGWFHRLLSDLRFDDKTNVVDFDDMRQEYDPTLNDWFPLIGTWPYDTLLKLFLGVLTLFYLLFFPLLLFVLWIIPLYKGTIESKQKIVVWEVLQILQYSMVTKHFLFSWNWLYSCIDKEIFVRKNRWFTNNYHESMFKGGLEMVIFFVIWLPKSFLLMFRSKLIVKMWNRWPFSCSNWTFSTKGRNQWRRCHTAWDMEKMYPSFFVCKRYINFILISKRNIYEKRKHHMWWDVRPSTSSTRIIFLLFYNIRIWLVSPDIYILILGHVKGCTWRNILRWIHVWKYFCKSCRN